MLQFKTICILLSDYKKLFMAHLNMRCTNTKYNGFVCCLFVGLNLYLITLACSLLISSLFSICKYNKIVVELCVCVCVCWCVLHLNVLLILNDFDFLIMFFLLIFGCI